MSATKVAGKRGRDWPLYDSHSPTHSPTNVASITTRVPILSVSPSKRIRSAEDMSGVSVSSPVRAASRPDSPFLHDSSGSGGSEQQQSSLDTFLPRARGRAAAEQPPPAQRMFTYEQVKDIVQRAVAEREAQLRLEYDRILQEQLQEQFRSFSKFNEDYISRQLKDTDLSYLS